MRFIKGNILSYYRYGWIGFPINGSFEVYNKKYIHESEINLIFPKLKYKVGKHLKFNGNTPYFDNDYRLVGFPIKHCWNLEDDFDLLFISSLIIRKEWGQESLFIPKLFTDKRSISIENNLQKLKKWQKLRSLLSIIFNDDRFSCVDREADYTETHWTVRKNTAPFLKFEEKNC